MEAPATQGVDVSAISSNAQPPQPGVPLDTHYYLTEGLEGIERKQYYSTRSFSNAIDKLHDEFDSGNSRARQYLVFTSVTQAQLENIHHFRETRRRHKSLSIMYLKSEEVLIVKIIPNCIQEMTHLGFGTMLYLKTNGMGRRYRLRGIGRATFEGILGQKEADSSFKPSVRRMAADWPTVVFQCGLAESLERLRVDCRWWLENSESTEVNIALLFTFSQAEKRIHIEQWEVLPVPNSPVSHTHSDPLTKQLTKTHEIDIVAGVASGAPLVLDFQKVFLRPPSPGAGDIVFSAEELGEYATDIWADEQ